VNTYFHQPEGRFIDDKPALVVPQSGFHASFQEWNHSLSDVLNAVVAAGLRIEFLHEHPFIVYKAKPYLVETGSGRFTIGGCAAQPPLMFSLKARADFSAPRP
jgi:hypothetical protein